MKDEELIQGCLRDDRNAQEMLYKKYYTAFLKICLRYCGDGVDAAHVLNEAFYKIFTRIHQYRADGNLEGWMKKIVVNSSLDFIRKKMNSKSMLSIEEQHERITAEEQSSIRLEMKDVLQQIRKLPQMHRLVLNLFVFEGMSHKEISSLLKISEGSSFWYLNKSRQLLREMMIQDQKEIHHG